MGGREQLALLGDLFDLIDRGHTLEDKVTAPGVLATSTDVASDTVGLVFHNGYALGFEGKAGEMVIMIEFIQFIRPNAQGGGDIELETGERVWLGFH